MGGGEGSTAREILRHWTVEKVIMCDIDEVNPILNFPFFKNCPLYFLIFMIINLIFYYNNLITNLQNGEGSGRFLQVTLVS